MTVKRTISAILRLFAGILITLLLLVAGFLAWQTIREFSPGEMIQLPVEGQAGIVPDTLTITTYNIGYCGLGAEMDFFYEGGKMARPGREQLSVYEDGVLKRLESFSGHDFILLQEVDTCARRSWYSNQLKMITDHFSDFDSFFAMNYQAWVPLPVTNPMGKVRAGLVTLSGHIPSGAVRFAFKTGYSWPMSLFMLKRCYLVTRYNTGFGNELVLVNTHNSAFSDAAEIRKTELAQLRELMETEYAKGNFVLIGGDWNQNPVGFDTARLLPQYLPKLIEPPIPDDFLPAGWKFAYDPRHSTNRDVDIPYTAGKTKTTLIDFFVLSPNLEQLFTETTETGFAEADHQPVTIRIVLKSNDK